MIERLSRRVAEEYKVTKPEEVGNDLSSLKQLISRFEKELQDKNNSSGGDGSYFHLVINGEYNRKTCDEVERIYTEAGWKNVECRTSSENGERGGLTGLILNK